MQAMQELATYTGNNTHNNYAVHISTATAHFIARRLKKICKNIELALPLTAFGYLVRRQRYDFAWSVLS